MPKGIDPKVKERCVQQMLEHVAEYPNPTAVADAIGKRNSVGGETVRRWNLQAQVDCGERQGATSDELAEIKEHRTPEEFEQAHYAALNRELRPV